MSTTAAFCLATDRSGREISCKSTSGVTIRDQRIRHGFLPDARLRELDRKCPLAEFFRVLRSLAPVSSADLRDALRKHYEITDVDVGLYLAFFQWSEKTIYYDGLRWHVVVGPSRMEATPEGRRDA